mgnify:FL=1
MFQLKQNELLFPICCYEVKNLFSDLGKTSGTQRYKAFSFYKDTMWFTLVLGLCLVSSIHGFSEGAGTSACKGNLQMKPGHQNLDFEDNDDKISIEAERESDDTLKITITTSEAFRGI